MQVTDVIAAVRLLHDLLTYLGEQFVAALVLARVHVDSAVCRRARAVLQFRLALQLSEVLVIQVQCARRRYVGREETK